MVQIVKPQKVGPILNNRIHFNKKLQFLNKSFQKKALNIHLHQSVVKANHLFLLNQLLKVQNNNKMDNSLLRPLKTKNMLIKV